MTNIAFVPGPITCCNFILPPEGQAEGQAKVKVKVTLQPMTSRSVSPGFKAHEGLTTGYLFLLTFTSIVLTIMGTPSDERSGLSFVIVRDI
jgi:hypothetical protein